MTGEQVIEELKDELAGYGLRHLFDNVDPNRAETLPVVCEQSREECLVCHSLAHTGRIAIPQTHLGKGNYSYICLDRNTCRKRVFGIQAEKNTEAGRKLDNLAKHVNLAKISSD